MEGTQRTEIDPREFRSALGHFASGITIATVVHEDTTHGMTANAFMSVSMDPPLVVVSADHKTTWHEKASESDRYGVSVLSEQQGALSNHFAGKPEEGIEIPFVWRNGVALIEGAIAQFVCRIVDAHPAGDHTLYIGQIEYLNYEEGKPLLFFTGEYGALKVEEVQVWEHSFWW
jgi:flavin reductase (DIM6/NTAB) family NADH-FMN oxidoreductase RutF